VFVSGRFDIDPVPRRVVVAAVVAFESVELVVFCGGVEVPAAALRFLLVIAGAVTAAGGRVLGRRSSSVAIENSANGILCVGF